MIRVTMSAVWDRATVFLGENRAIVLPIALALAAVPAGIAALLADIVSGMVPSQAMPLQLVVVALGLAVIIAQLAITALAINPALSAGEVIRVALVRLPKMLAITIGFGLAIVAALLPVLTVLFATQVDVSALFSGDPQLFQGAMRTIPRWVAWAILLYSLVLIVLLFWMSARLSLMLPVLVREGDMLAAVPRSFVLTRGLALKIFGVLLLLGVVSNVAQIAAKSVLGSLLILVGAGTGPFSATGVMVAVFVGLITAFFVALGAAFMAKLYVMLVGAKAGDIEVGDQPL
ncbi:MAG: hypothetical protein WC803_10495 [Sphingomonas sp.]|jgi:hypothetical protein